MPTLDELSAQVAALQQQVSAITTPPTEYYTSIYSGEEIDAAITKIRSGPTGINPNLLDNWYFVGGGTDGKFPVNQRGQTSYTAQGATFDRWKLYYSAGCTGKIDLLEDGIQITTTGDSQTYDYTNFQEVLDFSIDTSKEVCVSAIVDGVLYQSHGKIPVVGYIDGINRFELYSGHLRLIVLSGKTFKIQAVKIEYGSQQTLAHQDEDGNWVLNEIPNYGEELARCQRYLIPMDANCCWGFASSGTIAHLFFPLPVSMRTSPVFQGSLPAALFPVDGNSVTALSVFFPSAIKNMVALAVNGTGFTANKPYLLNQTIGFLSAEL